jgi:hypothetical protein
MGREDREVRENLSLIFSPRERASSNRTNKIQKRFGALWLEIGNHGLHGLGGLGALIFRPRRSQPNPQFFSAPFIMATRLTHRLP